MIRKYVTEETIKLYRFLSSFDIVPEFSIKQNMISMKLYDYNLSDFVWDNRLKKLPDSIATKINDTIDKLHSLDIFHGDLHSGNIVINKDGTDIRLIDFDDRYFGHISKLDEKKIAKIALFWGARCKNSYDVIKVEKTMWKLGLF